jgi:hypothetical protein
MNRVKVEGTRRRAAAPILGPKSSLHHVARSEIAGSRNTLTHESAAQGE